MPRALFVVKTEKLFVSPVGKEYYCHIDLIILYQNEHNLSDDEMDALLGAGEIKCGWTCNLPGIPFSESYTYPCADEAKNMAYGLTGKPYVERNMKMMETA